MLIIMKINSFKIKANYVSNDFLLKKKKMLYTIYKLFYYSANVIIEMKKMLKYITISRISS